ncbi:MCE family protein [Gordonia hankookensis]|uniref:MCE family protein n=1 Tax=Gordonia hankookensis TaxID=589403 RepID=A0ABR7W9M6_9ACTN|nr:MlaD family protein [Gordonia hankookensis]MBD1319511.1 MCE family protein [Gordonia hankookensis]
MSIRKPLIGLILFLLVSLALTSTVYVTLQRDVSEDTKSYSAVFTDITGLKAGDDVRMAGIRVGRVDSVGLDGTAARVSFRVDSDQVVDGSTKASIVYQNIVGQRYVGLSRGEFPHPAPLKGGEIPLAHTEPSFDISALLNGFEPLFSVLDPKQVDNVTEALIRALQGDSSSITTLVAETSSLAESVAGPDQVLGDVISNLSRVVGTFAAQRSSIDTVLVSSRRIFEQMSAQRDSFIGSLDKTAQVADRASTLARGALPEAQQMLSRQPGFLGHFLANKDEFGYLGFNLPPLLKGLARVTQAGAYIDTYLCNFNVTLVPALSTVIPSIVAHATPGGHVTQSPICR